MNYKNKKNPTDHNSLLYSEMDREYFGSTAQAACRWHMNQYTLTTALTSSWNALPHFQEKCHA